MARQLDLPDLDGALDLWGCMWTDEELERFETAVVRTLVDPHPRRVQLAALALCHVLGTPRLDAAAAGVAGQGAFSLHLIARIEEGTAPLHSLATAAMRLRGWVQEVELFLFHAVTGRLSAFDDALLDWIDVRDLVAVARTTLDSRLFAEVERRIARRGNYQRGRVRNLLGFRSPESYGTAVA